jgi:DNA-binding NtrC family response regulator
VLLVDDDDSLRRALVRTLRLDGFDVTGYASVEALLAAGVPEGDACLVLDVNMPGIDGIALGVACWPGTALVGMLTYSVAVTLYLAYVGFADGLSGPLLWPAVVLHAILTALLARASTSDKEAKTWRNPSFERLIDCV